jgi:hypothetical protein
MRNKWSVSQHNFKIELFAGKILLSLVTLPLLAQIFFMCLASASRSEKLLHSSCLTRPRFQLHHK